MRINSVVIHTDTSLEDLEFYMREVPKARYVVRSIVGIDAEEVIPRFYAMGATTRKKFYEYSMKPREIAMRLALNPQYNLNESAADLRDEIYRRISATRDGQVQLQFKSGSTVDKAISGMITKVEVAHFAKLPEVQVTVKCPDPIFRSIHPISYSEEELIEWSVPGTADVYVPDSHSTAPHGFTFRIQMLASSFTFRIADGDGSVNDWDFEVTPVGGVTANDEISFSSEFAAKELILHRGGVDTHIMDKVNPESIWPMIFPGQNHMDFNALSVANGTFLSFSYHAAYWGV